MLNPVPNDGHKFHGALCQDISIRADPTLHKRDYLYFAEQTAARPIATIRHLTTFIIGARNLLELGFNVPPLIDRYECEYVSEFLKRITPRRK